MVHHLIVNITFNSPEIRILGPIKEQTIDKLNEVLPNATTSSRSTRFAPPKFQYLSNPNHWYIKLDRQFCDDEGISHLMVLLLDALEEEGVWKLVSATSLRQPIGTGSKDYTESHVLFLNKLVGDDI
ncbi:uncharacterized protein TM35_000083150 [Trypanosoma theileri]|uniref:Paraflagellar rod component n=1 Tax=Trypanosoma theileri TaxID=67003 RepID=A0A1X0P0Q8_9TRYP|nr:uncharacterized protein TM35_000083150 [Trypanosoma theileri]ORC90517.1 hypothetical protein TM35_000083150 [Trypanosoma theileri]